MTYRGMQLEDFKWERTYKDMDMLFLQQGVYSYYDNYAFKILPSNKMAFFQVTFKPILQVFNRTQLLFEGWVEVSYHFEIGLLPEIKDSVLLAASAAHLEFMRLFNERESYTDLNAFEPKYHENLMKEHLDLHLRAAFFDNP
jgi:hypothetical protein